MKGRTPENRVEKCYVVETKSKEDLNLWAEQTFTGLITPRAEFESSNFNQQIYFVPPRETKTGI